MTGFLGLGSNIGDRRAHLQAAVDALPAHEVRVTRSSSVYETEPVGEVLEQRDFLNACIEIETALEPLELLDACKAVERELGRTSSTRHAPRVIDVDVLTLSARRFTSERLTLPHPSILERRFVLVPLLELGADGGLAQALERLGPGQAVRRVGEPLL